MNQILFNPSTKKQLDQFIARPVHALLLSGQRGSGKSTLLDWTASSLLGIDPDKLNNYPYFLKIMPNEKQIIDIDSIRQINHFLSLKVPADKNVSRIIAIDDGDKMKQAAQNALLKNLEEPPLSSVFILTCNDPNKLLPTIRSRTSEIRILRPLRQQLADYLLAQGLKSTKIEQIIALSGGYPGMAIPIAFNDKQPGLLTAAETAKSILQADKFARLSMVNELSKNSEDFYSILEMLELMANISLENAIGSQSRQWQLVLDRAYESKKMLDSSSNLKLTVTSFMLSI